MKNLIIGTAIALAIILTPFNSDQISFEGFYPQYNLTKKQDVINSKSNLNNIVVGDSLVTREIIALQREVERIRELEKKQETNTDIRDEIYRQASEKWNAE